MSGKMECLNHISRYVKNKLDGDNLGKGSMVRCSSRVCFDTVKLAKA